MDVNGLTYLSYFLESKGRLNYHTLGLLAAVKRKPQKLKLSFNMTLNYLISQTNPGLAGLHWSPDSKKSPKVGLSAFGLPESCQP